MRTSRSEYYLRKDFGFIDLGVPAAVGHTTVAVYEVIRRYVWRSTKVGNGISRKAYGDGRLVAKVSQHTIADLLGLTRRTVNKYVSLLRDVGWVQTEGKDDELVYILGERVEVEAGGTSCERELFYADAICINVAEEILEIAEKEGFEKVTRMPVGRRVALVKDLLGRNKGKPLEMVPEDEFEEGENNFLDPVNNFPEEGPPLGKKCAEKEENPTGYEKVREEGTTEVGTSLRSDPDSGPDPSLTEPPLPGELDKTRSAREKSGNGANVSDPVDHVVRPAYDRRLDVAQAIELGRARFEEQAELNRKKASVKEQKRRNRKGEEAHGDVKGLERVWTHAFEDTFPGDTLAAWNGRIRGQTQQLLKLYNVGEVEAGLKYVVTNWAIIKERFKVKGSHPTVSFLLRFHEALVPEAVKFSTVYDLKAEWDAWWRANPDKDPPRELKIRFDAYRGEMESLGLI